MNNLGIQNNRFYQQVIQNRIQCSVTHQPKMRRNQYYEKWLKQKQNEQESSSESCLEMASPILTQANIPNSFSVKLINDINQQRQLQY